MVIWNDLESDEKVRVYDRGVDHENTGKVFTICWSVTGPATCGLRIVDNTEALRPGNCAISLSCVLGESNR